jgi:hypothetical protein
LPEELISKFPVILRHPPERPAPKRRIDGAIQPPNICSNFGQRARAAESTAISKEKTYKNINFYYIKMGVYIIKSIHSNWIKVGHHKISEKRPSVYYRYLNRGFYSCICPSDIKDKVSFDDIELLYWFPNLNSSDENRIHKYLKYWYSSIGEWYDFDILNNVLKVICDEYGGISQLPTKEEYEEALTKRII